MQLTAAYKALSSLMLIAELNTDLSNLSESLRTDRLSLDVTITCFSIHRNIIPNSIPVINICCISLPQTSQFNFLGVITLANKKYFFQNALEFFIDSGAE